MMWEKLQRLKEPSTWGGLSALLMLAGINITGEQMQAVTNLLAAAAATAAVFMREKSGDK